MNLMEKQIRNVTKILTCIHWLHNEKWDPESFRKLFVIPELNEAQDIELIQVDEIMDQNSSPVNGDIPLSPRPTPRRTPRRSRTPRRAGSGEIRLRRTNSPVLRRRENRLTRISLAMVWLFLFCHVWKLIPTFYEVFVDNENYPEWIYNIRHVSHALIVLNSSVNFLIYVVL